MPQLTIFHLTFPRGFHIGRGGVESIEDSLEYIPSDTLFSALLDTWRYMGKEVRNLLLDKDEPVFRVTSAFPYAHKVRFYPKPIDLGVLFSKRFINNEGASKRLKKIRYLSEKLLLKAINGELLDEFLFPENEYDDPKEGNSLQGGEFWLLKEEEKDLPASFHLPDEKRWALRRKKVFSSQTTPRVTIDRISSASNLFQFERVQFSKGCGLWFGVAGDVESVYTILPTLEDAGLGGERTAGYGHFTCVKQPETLDFPDPGKQAYLLSRWHPKDNDEVALLQKPSSAYKLEAVEGWLRTPENAAAQRRKRLWMVTEGSLIEGNPQGDAANVAPEYEDQSNPGSFLPGVPHPIYRPGFAIALDWKREVTHEQTRL